MTSESKFLIQYGLHGFVTAGHPRGEPAFTIRRSEDPKMIRHATHLIHERYGKSAHIHLG